MAQKPKNVRVASSTVRNCKLTLPTGKKVYYEVPLELTAEEIVARAQAWVARPEVQAAYPELTLEACKLHWTPEIKEVQ